MMTFVLGDIRYGLRALRKAPAFTIVALLSLAIGIGANASIFSIVDALFLRPLPYKNADRLVILWNRSPGLGIAEDWFSTAQYFDIKTGHRGLDDVAIAIGGNENLTGDGEPERVGTIHVSSNLLPMLGVTAAIGRTFVAGEDVKGAAGTAILSNGLWIRRYGSNPNVIGRSLTIDGKTYQVIGVLPRGFSLPREVLPTLGGAEDGEILLPLPLGPGAPHDRNHEDYNIIGSLKAGVSVQQAQAEMDTLTARLRHDFPDVYPPNGGLTFGIVPVSDQVVGESRLALSTLTCAVALVLLIACANVASLQLSRALARQKEIAVRLAVGASDSRIVRQLLTESLLLSMCGGILGVILAVAALNWVRLLGPGSVPRLNAIHIDGRVLLFTFFISILAGTLFGLAPALRASRIDMYETLKEGSRGSRTSSVWGRGLNLRKSLVIGELAFSMLLLIGSSLLIRSFNRLETVPPGFNPHGVLTFELTMNGSRYGDAQTVLASNKELGERLEHLPGVTAVGGITSLPLSQMFAWGPITVEGTAPPPGQNFINADERIVSGHYFEAMEIPLHGGRFFDEHDTKASPRVAIIDDYMARELWPDVNALGKRFHTGTITDKEPWITVVGVAGRIKQYTLDSDSRIAFYLPQTQYPQREMNIVVRSNSAPQTLVREVKEQIRSLDRDLPIFRVKTMEQRLQESLGRRRFAMSLLTVFAVLALVLATIGIYGVVAYLVNQGTREIGIRLALGAPRRSVLQLILRQGMTLAATGAALGVFAALLCARLVRSLLFGVSSTDAFTFLAVPLALLLVSLVATYVPALRATRIDPAVSLRTD